MGEEFVLYQYSMLEEQLRGGQSIQGQRRGEENKGDEGRLIEERMVGEGSEGQIRGQGRGEGR